MRAGSHDCRSVSIDLNALHARQGRSVRPKRQRAPASPSASPGVREPPPVRMIRAGGSGEAALPEEVLLGVFQFGQETAALLPDDCRRLRCPISPLRFIASASGNPLPMDSARAAVTLSPPKGKLRMWMIRSRPANTATVSRAPISRTRAHLRKARFLHEARGQRHGIDVDHRRLAHVGGQERRPLADERSGGQGGENLRLRVRPVSV